MKKQMPKKISIVGAGAWGTTLACLLAEREHSVTLWAAEEELARKISAWKENRDFLPGFKIPESIAVTHRIEPAVDAEIMILTVPSRHLREVLKKFFRKLLPQTLFLSATKGLEENSLLRMSEVIRQEFPITTDRLAVLSGPNLAREIAAGHPAAAVIAADDLTLTATLQEIIMSERFRIYTSNDVIGVELGGALKNIIAIACGAADGLGFGDNAKAALMTRGMVEIIRLGTFLGARPATFWGLSGIGDLITTCSSRLSRNHLVGEELAKGRHDILSKTDITAEGIPTTRAANALSQKHGIEMPITKEVYQVLFEEKSPKAAVYDLMTRTPQKEF